MTLEELIQKASAGYPDGLIAETYDETTGRSVNRNGDLLAQFIAAELIETYNADASDGDQIDEARRVVSRAIDRLESVYSAIQ